MAKKLAIFGILLVCALTVVPIFCMIIEVFAEGYKGSALKELMDELE